MYDVVLSGYYGFGNSGDEALLKTIISDLRQIKNDIRIAVLSNDPEFTQRAYGVDSVHRMKFGEIRRVLKETKLLISGGGSLIQDATSSKSLFYYLGIIKLAKMCGAKVMVYANGVGPVRKSFNRKLTKSILNRVDSITLREPDSRDELEKMGVCNPEIKVTADPALGLDVCEDASELKLKLFGEKPLIAVSVRSWSGYDEKIVSSVSCFAEKFISDGYSVFLLPMQYSKDMDVCSLISEKTGAVILPDEYSVEQIAGILSCCEVIVGMRLHSVIYAAASGKPAVGIVYDPKVKSFMKYIGLKTFVDIEDVTSKSLIQAACDAMDNPMPDISVFRKLAFSNAETAIGILNRI